MCKHFVDPADWFRAHQPGATAMLEDPVEEAILDDLPALRRVADALDEPIIVTTDGAELFTEEVVEKVLGDP